MRDLIVTLNAHRSKFYRLGPGKSVTRSNLSKASEVREARIFNEYADRLIDTPDRAGNDETYVRRGVTQKRGTICLKNTEWFTSKTWNDLPQKSETKRHKKAK
jgi:hypothetical protein